VLSTGAAGTCCSSQSWPVVLMMTVEKEKEAGQFFSQCDTIRYDSVYIQRADK